MASKKIDATRQLMRYRQLHVIAVNAMTEAANATRARAVRAADARHNQPGGAREKQRLVKEAWASGKYSNRDKCAEAECGALGMSFSAARKALRNTPDPS